MVMQDSGEWLWLDTRQTLSVTELSRASGMSPPELDELIEYGALAPLDAERDERWFAADCVAALRTAGQLRRDYDLDLFAVAMLMDYLHRIEGLEAQLRAVQARLPGGVVG